MSTHAAEDEEGSASMVVKFQARGRECYNPELWDDGAYLDIQRILVHYDSIGIYSIQIEYIDQNGKPIWRAPNGRTPGHVSDGVPLGPTEVELDYPSEYLTSIHGYYNINSLYGITSLTFESNRKTWGPYGEKDGTKFSFPFMSVKIVGFHGATLGYGIDAIGVYVQPITKSKPRLPKPVRSKPEQFSLGVYGREEGEYWSENFVAIKRILIHHDDDWIISIQMEYVDENGKSVLSKKHGGDGGTLKQVVLEYPKEFLVTIEGYYDSSLDSKSATNNVIRLLTVITNRETHEPVGVLKGTRFKFPSDGRLKVVGIHGRSDSYLNAIGIYAVLI